MAVLVSGGVLAGNSSGTVQGLQPVSQAAEVDAINYLRNQIVCVAGEVGRSAVQWSSSLVLVVVEDKVATLKLANQNAFTDGHT